VTVAQQANVGLVKQRLLEKPGLKLWQQGAGALLLQRGHWCYVGLEAEVPEPGRLQAHRGRRALGDPGARRRWGNSTWWRTSARTAACASAASATATAKDFVCPYHQWNYTLKGDLQGVPFRRGVKQDGKVNGGMPPTSSPQGPRPDQAEGGHARRRGVRVSSTPMWSPFEDYLGPTILGLLRPLFNGRKLKMLGYNRQRIPATGS
jgi:salicylate 5-hydroxylase large subunit